MSNQSEREIVKGLGQVGTELVVEAQLCGSGRLPRAPVPENDLQKDERAAAVTKRVLNAVGWNTAAMLVRRTTPANKSADDRAAAVAAIQLRNAGRPAVARG